MRWQICKSQQLKNYDLIIIYHMKGMKKLQDLDDEHVEYWGPLILVILNS